MQWITRSFCLCGWLMLATTGPVQAITIDLIPNYQELEVGTPLTVEIAISELTGGAAPSLGVFDLDLVYDATMLSFAGPDGVNFGNQLDLFDLGSVRAIEDSTPGVVNLFELSLDLADDLDNLQLADFSLATLTFDTLIEGMSTLALSINALGDSIGAPLTAQVNGVEINITASTQVPEPAPVLLLITSLAGLYWLRRKNPD
ncbi:MAG: PEP-CTERM sorting domain-containing protein [Candidatus Thiodiazotropha sp.]